MWFPICSKPSEGGSKILTNINKKQVLHGLIGGSYPDLVICDNRYGFSSPVVPSVFITHQLNIIAPFKWAENRSGVSITTISIALISAGFLTTREMQMTGPVFTSRQLPLVLVKYLGPLSRFTYRAKVTHSCPIFYFLFRVLSQSYRAVPASLVAPGRHVLLSGANPGEFDDSDKFECAPKLHGHQSPGNNGIRGKLRVASEYVISRSGYTTMEILSLRENLLIPTPGQNRNRNTFPAT